MEEDPKTRENNPGERRQEVGRRLTDKQLKEIADMRSDMQQYMQQNDKNMSRGEEQFKAIMVQIAHLSKSISTVDENTKDLVKSYNDFKAAARVGNAIRDFLVNCAKWGGIFSALGYVIYRIVNFMSDQDPPPRP